VQIEAVQITVQDLQAITDLVLIHQDLIIEVAVEVHVVVEVLALHHQDLEETKIYY